MKFKQVICIFLSIIIFSGSAGISLAAYAVTDTAEVSLTGQSAINGFEIYNGVLVKYSGLSSNVVIPTGVTRIRGLAFADCPNVMRIYIPASVTVIEKNVFFSLKSPHEINIDIDSGNKNYTIEDGVVFDKEKTRLILCSAKKIGKYSIPKTVINIEDNAFLGCKNLTNIEIPKSVTSIGSNAFMACTKLTDVAIPTSVTSMNFSAFEGTPWLVNYPNDFVVAGNGILLCYKGSKKNVKIPNNVKSIGALAFSNCNELESVDIPISVTSIGDEAFYVHIYDDLEGNIFISKLTNVSMPASITSIGDEAFLECQKLSNIRIPASVTSIGNRAFKGCQILPNIEIPDSVTFIGGGAFEECGMLSSIKIPDSVTGIGDRTFYGCQSLTSIKISENITSIGDDAFFGTPWFNNFKDDFVVAGNHILVGYKGTETKVKIPTNVKSIADGALSDLKNITDATIPIGIKAISNYMFSECRKLQRVSIPRSVTVIGKGAFSTCVRLTNIIL
ncbi:MAG: leucine-rich repeat domain-containing protein, partial [Eubacteriales bacterium]